MGNLQVSCCAAERPKPDPVSEPKLKVILAYDCEGQMQLHFRAEDQKTGEPIPVATSEVDERHFVGLDLQQTTGTDCQHKRGPSGR